MTSEAPGADRLHRLDRLYVWVWLPGAADPVVAGVLVASGAQLGGERVLTFTYAASYRARRDAISLFDPELPLRPGTFDPTQPVEPTGAPWAAAGRAPSPLPLHGALRDAAPDAWGRRVINLRLASSPDADLSELTYLAHSSSDRIGALDFQLSPTEYVPRGEPATLAQLEQLGRMAATVEAGDVVPEELATAAGHGTSVGGARPKALLIDDSPSVSTATAAETGSTAVRHLIAKFPSSTDTRPVVKAEAVAMLLAAEAGLDVAPVEVRDLGGRGILLVERFDRPAHPVGARRQMLSALTILGYQEMSARHATYVELADAIRSGPWTQPAATLRELFSRMVFNVCVGNTDDHLRNHAAFWDGRELQLTPAYDVAPQPRSTRVATHAIGLTRDGKRTSQLRLCRQAAPDFLLTPADAIDIIDHVIATIRTGWQDACDQALLTRAERAQLMGREVLNPYVFDDED